MKQRIVFLQGVNDSGQVGVLINEAGKLQLLLDGGSNTYDFLKNDEFETEVKLLVPADQSGAVNLLPPSIIFNEISDPDSHQISLGKAKRIRDFFPDLPCINEPRHVESCTRDKVSQKLSGIAGVIAPKTVRVNLNSVDDVVKVWNDHFHGSIIVRKAGKHGGVSTVRLDSLKNLQQLDTLALDGGPFYVSQFIDFRSHDGNYRKYRIVVVNGRAFLRHVIVSDHWLIHSSSRSFMNENGEYAAEEEAALENFAFELGPRIESQCESIFEKLKLDYFGIDCSITEDDQLLIFEANANMNVLINNQPTPNIWEKEIGRIVASLKDLLRLRLSK